MKKATIIILSIALLAVGGIFALAQTTDGPMGDKRGFGKRGMHKKSGRRGMRGHRRGMGRMFRDLNLTDAQKVQMQAILKSSRESGKALRKEMRTNAMEFRKNENPSDSQVQAFASKQGDLHAKMIVHRAKVKSQLHSILTTEQKAKLAEKKAAHKKRMEERKAKWAERKKSKAKAQ